MRNLKLNLPNTLHKWQSHSGFTTNTHSNPAKVDSDSELSALFSSLFNGIEGIEMVAV